MIIYKANTILGERDFKNQKNHKILDIILLFLRFKKDNKRSNLQNSLLRPNVMSKLKRLFTFPNNVESLSS